MSEDVGQCKSAGYLWVVWVPKDESPSKMMQDSWAGGISKSRVRHDVTSRQRRGFRGHDNETRAKINSKVGQSFHACVGDGRHAKLKNMVRHNNKQDEINDIRFRWSPSYEYLHNGDQTIGCVYNAINFNSDVVVDAYAGILQQTRYILYVSLICITSKRSCGIKKRPICKVCWWNIAVCNISN